MDRIRARADAEKEAADAARGERGIAGKRFDALQEMKRRRGHR